jgi:putative peptide zinc metalloprotease protein
MATYLLLRPGCTFHPFHNGSDRDEYLLRTPDERQFRISAAAYKILSELQGGLSLEEVYAGLPGTNATFVEFRDFVLKHYQAFLASGEESARPMARAPMKLLLHYQLLPGTVVARIAARLATVYHASFAFIFVFLIVAAHVALYSGFQANRPGTIHTSLALLAAFFSVVVHEFGHASAVARFGGTPGSIGAGLYILMPVLYADVSQVWSFRPRQRIVVDLGGIYFQQICFAFLAVMALLLHSASLRAACISIDVMTAVSINPVFRFDGYWILVDWLGVPNLHRHAGAYLKTTLKSLARLRWPQPALASLQASRLKAAIFVAYAVLGNLLVAAAVLLNLRWVKSTALAIFRQTPVLWAQIMASTSHHEVLKMLDMATSLALVVASGLTLTIALWLRGIGMYERLRRVPESRQAAKGQAATHA